MLRLGSAQVAVWVCLLVSCEGFGQSDTIIRKKNSEIIKNKLDTAHSINIHESGFLGYSTSYLMKLYLDILVLDSINIEALLGLGGLGSVPEISGNKQIQYLNKAIRLDSINEVAYLLRGYKYEDAEKYQLAIQDYKKSLRLNSLRETDPNLIEPLANCYFRLKNYKEAQKWYTVLIEKNDYDGYEATWTGYRKRAFCKYKLGDKKGACDDYIKSHPHEKDPCNNLEKMSNGNW